MEQDAGPSASLRKGGNSSVDLSPESTLHPLTSALVGIPHTPGSPPTLPKPQGSLTLVLLGEYCSPSPRFHPILPGFQDIRTLLMREGQSLTKMLRGSDNLFPALLNTRSS